MDKHYWKNAYKEFWNTASNKETYVKKLIESHTGYNCIEVGFGAGSTEFLNGNARDNNHSKGDADLYIVDKDCFVEVTGPNIRMDKEKPLWIRPDKLRNAYRKLQSGRGRLHVIVHVLSTNGDNKPFIRVVVLDNLFFSHIIDKKSFRKINPVIRGLKETYYELPPKHETIISLEQFIERLQLL